MDRPSAPTNKKRERERERDWNAYAIPDISKCVSYEWNDYWGPGTPEFPGPMGGPQLNDS